MGTILPTALFFSFTPESQTVWAESRKAASSLSPARAWHLLPYLPHILFAWKFPPYHRRKVLWWKADWEDLQKGEGVTEDRGKQLPSSGIGRLFSASNVFIQPAYSLSDECKTLEKPRPAQQLLGGFRWKDRAETPPPHGPDCQLETPDGSPPETPGPLWGTAV